MYIVNTTFIVDPSIHGKWMEFIVKKIIPRLKEEKFGPIMFTRVLSEQSDGHYTYSLQTHLADMVEHQRYTNEVFPDYLQIAVPMFGAKVNYFTSLLKKVEY